MAQQLVLVPKAKYDYLLSKSQSLTSEKSSQQCTEDKSKNSLQMCPKKENVSLEQKGEGFDLKKRLYVHKSDIVFGKKNNKKIASDRMKRLLVKKTKSSQKNPSKSISKTIPLKTIPLKTTKEKINERHKRKWISYNVL